MKKLLAMLLAAAMLLTLCACGDKAADKDTNPSETAPSTLEAPATADEVATTFLRAYYFRDYITRFSLTFYDARRQWEDNAIQREGSAEAFFALTQQQAAEKGITVEIRSFDDYYKRFHQFSLDDTYNVYGENEVSVTVTESKKMTADELNEFRDKQLGALDEKYVDEDAYYAVTEAYVMTVKIVIDGTKKDYSESYRVYLVNHNGQWLVADHSI